MNSSEMVKQDEMPERVPYNQTDVRHWLCDKLNVSPAPEEPNVCRTSPKKKDQAPLGATLFEEIEYVTVIKIDIEFLQNPNILIFETSILMSFFLIQDILSYFVYL
jgi:hypothetical protein